MDKGPLCYNFIDHLGTPGQFDCCRSLSHEQVCDQDNVAKTRHIILFSEIRLRLDHAEAMREILERKVARRYTAMSKRDAKIARLRKTYGTETLQGVGLVESEGNWEGPEYQDIANNGKKKEVKTFTFHRMETKEVCERYITPCFVEGLDAYDGITDLKYEKNLISNVFAVKLGLQYELKKNADVKTVVTLTISIDLINCYVIRIMYVCDIRVMIYV
ncbi:hypothetical protein Tco_1428825 [Tanacetum coccineum]